MAREGIVTRALRDRVEIYADLAPFWQAFVVLSAARGGGWGPQPIQVEAVYAYARLVAFPRDLWGDLLFAVRILDRELMQLDAEKQKKPDKKRGKQYG